MESGRQVAKVMAVQGTWGDATRDAVGDSKPEAQADEPGT
jgi:hypothetical protein